MNENIISLIDEETGIESSYEIIMTLDANDKEYAVLYPLDEEDSEEALVFRIDSDEEGEILVPLEDEEEYQIVLDAYEVIMEQEGLNYEE